MERTWHNAFDGGEELIYRKVFADYMDMHPISVQGENVFTTYHLGEDGIFVVAVNHSDVKQDLHLMYDGYCLEKVYYGNAEKVDGYDACVLKFRVRS